MVLWFAIAFFGLTQARDAPLQKRHVDENKKLTCEFFECCIFMSKLLTISLQHIRITVCDIRYILGNVHSSALRLCCVLYEKDMPQGGHVFST